MQIETLVGILFILDHRMLPQDGDYDQTSLQDGILILFLGMSKTLSHSLPPPPNPLCKRLPGAELLA